MFENFNKTNSWRFPVEVMASLRSWKYSMENVYNISSGLGIGICLVSFSKCKMMQGRPYILTWSRSLLWWSRRVLRYSVDEKCIWKHKENFPREMFHHFHSYKIKICSQPNPSPILQEIIILIFRDDIDSATAFPHLQVE